VTRTTLYQSLADAVLILHVGVVLFIVGGLLLIVVGNLRAWPWVNRLWFRLAHLAAIAVVVGQSWAGMVCPLTTLESWLRRLGGGAGYGKGFIEHWLQDLLFYQAPTWVFTLAYSAFGLAVIAVWWRFPVARRAVGRAPSA
jgi:polyferredoxin